MKKKLLLGLLLLLVLFGCKKEEEEPNPKDKLVEIKEPIKLDEKQYNSKEFIDIDSEKLKSLEEEKTNFAIFVYAPGCLSCAAFRVVLEEYVEKYNMSFYTISTPEMKKTDISEFITYAPSMAL